MTRLIKNLALFLFFFSCLAFPICSDSDQDPDECFDHMGQSVLRQYKDSHADPSTRVFESRENLGSGIVTSNAGNDSEGGRSIVVGDNGVIFVAGRTGNTNDFLIMKYFPDGSLDTSFDTDGMVSHTFGNTDDWAHGIAIQTNGVLVVAGRSDHGSANAFDFAVLRLKTTGSLDTTFDTDGKKLVDITGAADIARGVVLQGNSKIILAGYAKNANYDFAFVRLETDGNLDTSFSNDGKTTVANGTSDDGALAVATAMDSDGRIVGAGNSYNGTDWDNAAVVLMTDGSLDTTFHTDGMVTQGFRSGKNDSAYAVVTDLLTSRITLVGVAVNQVDNQDFSFLRLESSGALDTTFSTDGKQPWTVGSSEDGAYGASLQADGLTLLASGYTYNGANNDFAVLRIMSNAVLDTSFFTNGKFTKALGTAEDTAQAMFQKGDGTIFVAGRYDTNASAYDIALIRLQSNGTLAESGAPVLSFGPGGTRSYDFGGTENAYMIIGDTQGRILQTGLGNGTDFAVDRILVNGSLDTTFHTDGKQMTDWGGTDTPYAIALQTDGKMVLCGAGNGFHGIVRYETDGVLDTSFATDGTKSGVAGKCTKISIQTDAKLLMSGDTGSSAYFARFHNNGSIDTSFATDGDRVADIYANDEPQHSVLNTNRGILHVYNSHTGVTPYASGMIRVRASGYDPGLVADGALDTTFSNDGLHSFGYLCTGGDTTVSGITSLALNSEDKTYLAAYDTGMRSSASEMCLARVRTDAGLDTTFNTTGVYASVGTVGYPGGVAVAQNDKVVTFNWNGADVFFIRVHTNGVVDTTFGTDGIPPVINNSGTDRARGIAILHNGWLCGSLDNGTPDLGIACVWQ